MRAFIVLVLAVWFAGVVALPVARAQQQSNYQQCAQMVQHQAAKALDLADELIQQTNHPSAYHCRALALFALQNYPEAAKALERLSVIISQSNPLLWGNVIRQAARSWSLASESAKAIVVLSKGIHYCALKALNSDSLAPLCADLLHDRAKIYAAGGRDLFALQDLDQALSLSPDNAPMLITRAKLFLSQQENALALRDLQRLQTVQPSYPGLSKLMAPLQ